MTNISFYRLIKLSLLFTLITFSVSCSKTPDVRLTLCQDVTKILLGSSTIEWQQETVKMPGHNDLEMLVPFTISGSTKSETAVCYYRYEAEEPEATSFNDPASAYSTYPHKMILKGKAVDQNTLSRAVNQAMAGQGKAAINKAKEGIKQAADSIKKELQ